MHHLTRIFADHPAPASDAGDEAHALVQATAECAAACTACADACLAEDGVAHLRDCIRACLDCADVCVLAGRLVARPGKQDAEVLRTVLGLCATACRSCADECVSHDDMAHCTACADACRACAAACEAMQAAIVG